jgi:TonB family protein
MRTIWIMAISLLLAGNLAVAQDAPSSLSAVTPQDSSDYPDRFVVGDGVVAPELLPMNLPVAQDHECKDRLSGEITLSFLVSADGVPKNIAFERGSGRGQDELALRIISLDRFKPAMHDGEAVTVPMTVEVEMEACTVDIQSLDGKKQAGVKPRLEPRQKFTAMSLSQADLRFFQIEKVQRIGYSESDGKKTKVTAPVPLNSVNAIFSDEARKNKVSGICLVTMIVDTEGITRNVRVKRALGYGLDERAVEAAKRYRFKPAMANGVPVPVMIMVVINFRLY